MSETYAYVACTCWRDGLTTDPPIPRSEVVYDRFGNIMIRGSLTPDDDTEEFWDWRYEQACSHHDMRLIEDIWQPVRWRKNQRVLEALSPYPVLCEVLDAGEWASQATVLATPESAKVALGEWDALFSTRPQGSTQVVVDESGHAVHRLYYDPDDPGDSFVGLSVYLRYCQRHARSPVPEDLIEIGVRQGVLVVRRCADSQELLRSAALTQEVLSQAADGDTALAGDDLSIRWESVTFSKIRITDPDSGRSVEGYSIPMTCDTYSDLSGYERQQIIPQTVRTAAMPSVWSDLYWPLGPMRAYLQAAVDTGNPMVGYYTNNSLGY